MYDDEYGIEIDVPRFFTKVGKRLDEKIAAYKGSRERKMAGLRYLIDQLETALDEGDAEDKTESIFDNE